MNKEMIFAYLKHYETEDIIKLLNECYNTMKTDQRYEVFYHIEKIAMQQYRVASQDLINKVNTFKQRSLDGDYYAPFDINSKNCMHIPEETKQWFEEMRVLLNESTLLSNQEDHAEAVECFQILYDLIDKLGCEEIVFADEYGEWMIGVDENQCMSAYQRSYSALKKLSLKQ